MYKVEIDEFEARSDMQKNICLKNLLLCKNCGSQYSIEQIISFCKKCGFTKSHLEFEFEILNSKRNSIQSYIKKNSMNSIRIKYAPLLPFDNLEEEIHLPEIIMTPLYKSSQIAHLADVSNVWLKDETRNITGSIKDRASFLGVIAAKYINKANVVVTASTGNQAISVAALAAAAELKSIVYVSENAAPYKLKLLEQYGAKITKISGTYDDAYEACLKITEKNCWINKSAGLSPLCIEGMKTTAYEICEQMNWNPPQVVFVPVGDGTVYSSIAKGFIEFFKLGIIPKIPKLIGVQSTQCKSAVLRFNGETVIQDDEASNKTQTIAESISVGTPRDYQKLLNALKDTSGDLIDVDDQLIFEMKSFFTKNNGINLELASATVLAGLLKARKIGLCDSNDSVLLILTGNGYKEKEKS